MPALLGQLYDRVIFASVNKHEWKHEAPCLCERRVLPCVDVHVHITAMSGSDFPPPTK